MVLFIRRSVLSGDLLHTTYYVAPWVDSDWCISRITRGPSIKPGTRNIPEHEKIKIIFMKKNVIK